jgi:hypothetical protein
MSHAKDSIQIGRALDVLSSSLDQQGQALLVKDLLMMPATWVAVDLVQGRSFWNWIYTSL